MPQTVASKGLGAIQKRIEQGLKETQSFKKGLTFGKAKPMAVGLMRQKTNQLTLTRIVISWSNESGWNTSTHNLLEAIP